MKLDDITVISHPKNPNNPAVASTEITQVKIGKMTHLNCLNIIIRANIIKNSMF